MSDLLDLLCKSWFLGAFEVDSKYTLLIVLGFFGLLAACLMSM